MHFHSTRIVQKFSCILSTATMAIQCDFKITQSICFSSLLAIARLDSMCARVLYLPFLNFIIRPNDLFNEAAMSASKINRSIKFAHTWSFSLDISYWIIIVRYISCISLFRSFFCAKISAPSVCVRACIVIVFHSLLHGKRGTKRTRTSQILFDLISIKLHASWYNWKCNWCCCTNWIVADISRDERKTVHSPAILSKIQRMPKYYAASLLTLARLIDSKTKRNVNKMWTFTHLSSRAKTLSFDELQTRFA